MEEELSDYYDAEDSMEVVAVEEADAAHEEEIMADVVVDDEDEDDDEDDDGRDAEEAVEEADVAVVVPDAMVEEVPAAFELVLLVLWL
jgi:hypothetical protein